MKILMVCLGNICRSPLAEGIIKQQVKEAGLDWEIDSAGTGNWHIGEAPDQRSTLEAKTRGVDISQQVCRQFNVQDFDGFDLILVMDKNNRRDVLSLARNQHDRDKVKLLLNDQEVPDPYFNDHYFSPVFDLIEGGCKDIIKKYKD
ncbi:MAG: low molecular weight protein-tyrosine-phosphatase [Mucilaginibacter sp.]|uniref:low molecular weight protein-tyrosine-phosphatase n=1 Tax=Mucilaginibacter sp. TaxID=1882438 RepID=UPI0034E5BA34